MEKKLQKPSSLSVISNNIAKIIHKIICKYQLDDKKCETW